MATSYATGARERERGSRKAAPERRRRERNGAGTSTDVALARALGWLSIGLGVAEVAAPRAVGELAGLGERRGLLRAFGLRELASGIGILASRQPTPGLWARVVGDALDLAVLGAAMVPPNPKRGRAALATAAVTGVTALDLATSLRMSGIPGSGVQRAIRTKKSVIVDRPAEDLHRFWRDVSNAPRFMVGIESVRPVGERRSHWVMKGPAGKRLEWDAEIVGDRPPELIAWRTLDDAPIPLSGSVRFERAPGGRGTMVTLEVEYRPPAGALGAAVATLFGLEPGQLAQEDLRRLKQLTEAGELATTEGSPSARKRSPLRSGGSNR